MSRISVTALLLLVGLATSCATLTPDLPAITDTPTGQRHAGKVVWHDLLTNTPAASREFYGELFGWTFENPGIDIGFGGDDDYMLIRHEGRLIGGMINTNALGKKENISQWITMISVTDIAQALAEVTAGGGKVLTPATDLRSRGTLAVAEDPQGAVFAMLQTRGGDPADYEPVVDGFLWDELWTSDVPAASDYYSDVFDYSVDNRPIGDTQRSYQMLKSKSAPRAGILANPYEGERPVWVNYLRVTSPAAITAQVEALGGRILLDAQARDIGGEVAFIAGPSGAGIALQTWPLTQN